jgi:uncharacterized membrane protein YeaQ/YmgE (transglycosylase-associated protein family)
MSLDSIAIWIIVGGIAGLLAEWLIGGVNAGCIGTVIIGILGAFIGGWLFGFFHIAIGSGIVNNIITAFAGAAVLLFAIRLIRRV